MRRLALHSLALLIMAAAWCSLSARQISAQEVSPATADPLTEIEIVNQVTDAIDRAQDYLASKQGKDGAWTGNNAANALALLSFLGRGHVPGRGPYYQHLERGKRFVLSTQRADGLFVSPKGHSNGPMYEHALATLAVAEMYGMAADPQTRSKLHKAVQLIVRVQSPNGGWRYKPKPGDHDLSVTVMQIVALRAANNANVPVPATTIDKAIGYVRSCAHKDGGFTYQPGRKDIRPAMSAAGILSLQLLGQYQDPTIKPALDYLAKMPVEWKKGRIRYFCYFHYYAIQAHYQAGGSYWSNWHPRVREMFLSRQNADGSWDVPAGTAESNTKVVGPNKIYWTAMASLVLEIYLHFLPAYQR